MSLKCPMTSPTYQVTPRLRNSSLMTNKSDSNFGTRQQRRTDRRNSQQLELHQECGHVKVEEAAHMLPLHPAWYSAIGQVT